MHCARDRCWPFMVLKKLFHVNRPPSKSGRKPPATLRVVPRLAAAAAVALGAATHAAPGDAAHAAACAHRLCVGGAQCLNYN